MPKSKNNSLEKFSHFVDISVKLAAIITICFTIFKFLEQKQENRISETLLLASEFRDSSSAVGSSSRKISERLNLFSTQFAKIKTRDPFTNLEENSLLYRNFLIDVINGDAVANSIMPDIFEVISFFDTLFICTINHICDEKTATMLLGSYAETFWNNFSEIIIDERTQYPDLGRGLEYFSDRHRLETG